MAEKVKKSCFTCRHSKNYPTALCGSCDACSNWDARLVGQATPKGMRFEKPKIQELAKLPTEQEMDITEMVARVLNVAGKWKLEWEVLWITFEMLKQTHNLTNDDIYKALTEGLWEWDIGWEHSEQKETGEDEDE